MAELTRVPYAPRKTPVQARSAASVEAILDATLQVLLMVGKGRLTTTRVALRAGVSVGTLYQYFPNKTVMLRSVLERHLETVTAAMEEVCAELHGRPLSEMAEVLVTGFLKVKVRDVKTSVALYALSADVDGVEIARVKGTRSHRSLVAMLRSAEERLVRDPEMMATVVEWALAGVSRKLLESESPEQIFEALRTELVFLVSTYLEACRA